VLDEWLNSHVRQGSSTGEIHLATELISLNVAQTTDYQQQSEDAAPMDESQKTEEASGLSAALLRSRIEDPPAELLPLSSDGIAVFRITSMAHTPQVLDMLLSSPTLEMQRRRVASADCDIIPEWGCGAKFLVPFTENQFLEFIALGLEIQSHHIIALGSDFEDVKAACAEITQSRRNRPKISMSHAANAVGAEVGDEEPEELSDLVVMKLTGHWPSTNSSQFWTSHTEAANPAWANH